MVYQSSVSFDGGPSPPLPPWSKKYIEFTLLPSIDLFKQFWIFMDYGIKFNCISEFKIWGWGIWVFVQNIFGRSSENMAKHPRRSNYDCYEENIYHGLRLILWTMLVHFKCDNYYLLLLKEAYPNFVINIHKIL